MRASVVGALLLLSAGASSCATVGLRCSAREPACEQVRVHVEVARAHAGEENGSAVNNARLEVTRLGARGVPWLVRALDDDEPAVTAFAARALMEMGRENEVTRWCQTSAPNVDQFCSSRDGSSGGSATPTTRPGSTVPPASGSQAVPASGSQAAPATTTTPTSTACCSMSPKRR